MGENGQIQNIDPKTPLGQTHQTRRDRMPRQTCSFVVVVAVLCAINLGGWVLTASRVSQRSSDLATQNQNQTETEKPQVAQQFPAVREREAVLVVLGTRPEVIKMAPVVWEMRKRCASWSCRVFVVSTNQQSRMTRAALRSYGLEDDLVELPEPTTYSEGHSRVAAHILVETARAIRSMKPRLVFVQGDTTTAMVAAQAAFHEGVPVAHVEAGLRTGDLHNPFPEEYNRRVVAVTAAFHFAPTTLARDALLREGVNPRRVWVTGNTVVDALFARLRGGRPSQGAMSIIEEVSRRCGAERDCGTRPQLVLVTMHRRESWGKKMEDMCSAILEIARRRPSAIVVLPVHSNPAVASVVIANLENKHPRVMLTQPIGQDDFPFVLNASTIVITDSGGVQEEGVSLGKPILVMRDTTERPEGVLAGNSLLVGRDPGRIWETAVRLLANDGGMFDRMSTPHFPYGTGNASLVIAEVLRTEFFQPQPGSQSLRPSRSCAKGIVPPVASAPCFSVTLPAKLPTSLRVIPKDSVTVVLNVYKRKTLPIQIEAVRNQTHKVLDIVAWQNGNFVDVSDVVRQYNVTHVHSSRNYKFHGRFLMPLLFDSEYTLILDDDVMPGSRWIENCMRVSKAYNAIVGGNGRIISNASLTVPGGCIGDMGTSPRDTLVDFVGHSWFFRTEWVRIFWSAHQPSWDNGEDVDFGASLWLTGINSYVPKMPPGDRRLSSDNSNMRFANDAAATYRTPGHKPIRSMVANYWLDLGWKVINNVTKVYVPPLQPPHS